MKIKIQKRQKGHITQHHLHEELRIAQKFSKVLVKQFKDTIKSVILGRRRNELEHHLVNIYIIIDDVTQEMNKEAINHYVNQVHKIIKKVSSRIQAHTLKLSTYWDKIVEMPVDQIEQLRKGYAVYDVGFYEPLQQLLYRGRVKPSYESMGMYFIRAPETLRRAKGHVKQAVVDLYWAVMDAAQAALMKQGELSPSPAHVADLMETTLVHTNLLERHYVHTVDKFYHIAKDIEHEEVREVSGKQYDEYFEEAVGFIKRMRKLMKVQS